MLAWSRAAGGGDGATNVEFVEAEAERLPFPEASFDVVIANGVIDLIRDKDALLFRNTLSAAALPPDPTSASARSGD